MSNLAGQSWGHYAIFAKLSEDDLGITYHARDNSSGRDVRLWVLHGSVTRNNPSLERRLISALDRLQSFDHPNAAHAMGLEWIDEQLCVFSEHVPGPTLRSVLSERGALPARRAAGIAHDLALALEAAHEQGIQQIDLRPTHVVLSDNGQAVLTDMGLEHLVRSLAPQSKPSPSTRLPAYVAPETARGDGPVLGSDIYALGITLYEMLTSHPPFQGTDTEVLLAHQNKVPQPPSQVARRVPKALDAVVEKALAKELAARYQSAKEMADDLEGFDQSRKSPTPLPWRIRVPIGLIVAVAVLGLVTWWAISSLSDARKAEPIIAQQGYSGIVGAYEVTLPKKVRPDEPVTVRLTVYAPDWVTYDDLPAMPASSTMAEAPGPLAGTIPLCQQLWASLESPNLEIIGAGTLRRTIRGTGAEWVWNVCCRPGAAGSQSAYIRIFARSEESGAPSEILLKQIPFSLDASTSFDFVSSTELGIAIIGAVMVSIIVLLIATRKRAPLQSQ